MMISMLCVLPTPPASPQPSDFTDSPRVGLGRRMKVVLEPAVKSRCFQEPRASTNRGQFSEGRWSQWSTGSRGGLGGRSVCPASPDETCWRRSKAVTKHTRGRLPVRWFCSTRKTTPEKKRFFFFFFSLDISSDGL